MVGARYSKRRSEKTERVVLNVAVSVGVFGGCVGCVFKKARDKFQNKEGCKGGSSAEERRNSMCVSVFFFTSSVRRIHLYKDTQFDPGQGELMYACVLV